MSQCPKLTKDEKAKLFLQMEGGEGKEGKEGDDQYYSVNGELDRVCGLNAAGAPQSDGLMCPGRSFTQVAPNTLHEDR